jgi:hypothetical protein
MPMLERTDCERKSVVLSGEIAGMTMPLPSRMNSADPR